MPNTKKKGRATPIDGHVGARLRQRRSLMQVTQESLANALGITFQQVQKYENGTNRISAARLYDISKLLDVSPEFFFKDYQETSSRSAPKLGLADNDQSPFAGEEDIMQRKETIELTRVYYSIQDPKLRKNLFNFVKSMAESLKEQDGNS